MGVHKLKNRPPSDNDERVEELRRLSRSAPPITTNPERLGGTPVIALTRVPVSALLDYFATGHSLDEFLQQFPTVSREQAVAALDHLKEALEENGSLAERVDY
jgi:uncharacterized protein (DUF433 family)